LKNHSRNLHAPFCGLFDPNSVAVARYGALIRAKSSTNCDAHLAKAFFRPSLERQIIGGESCKRDSFICVFQRSILKQKSVVLY